MNITKTIVFICASLCLLSCTFHGHVEAADVKQEHTDSTKNDIDCPGSGTPFVSSCSGTDTDNPQPGKGQATKNENDVKFDETLVDETLNDLGEKGGPEKCGTMPTDKQQIHHGLGDMGDAGKAIQQLRETAARLTKRYYNPLPRQAKCAVGVVCGFTSARLSLGAANRAFRMAGATWVLAETLHTSGFCDEAKCVPGEVRPWIGIARHAVVKQCQRVRALARSVWNQDRIREFAEKDELVAGGFAAGAFIGFIV